MGVSRATVGRSQLLCAMGWLAQFYSGDGVISLSSKFLAVPRADSVVRGSGLLKDFSFYRMWGQSQWVGTTGSA